LSSTDTIAAIIPDIRNITIEAGIYAKMAYANSPNVGDAYAATKNTNDANTTSTPIYTVILDRSNKIPKLRELKFLYGFILIIPS